MSHHASYAALITAINASPNAAITCWTSLLGRSILARTLDTFVAQPFISPIILLIHAEHLTMATQLCQQEQWEQRIQIATASSHHRQSIRTGLTVLAQHPPMPERIILHDVMCPLVSSTLLERAFTATQRHPAVAAAVPVKDTIKQAFHSTITATLDRSQLFLLQTPQIFSSTLLNQAYQIEHMLREDSDTMTLLEQLHIPIHLFPGSYANIAITTAEDLLLAEALLEGNAVL